MKTRVLCRSAVFALVGIFLMGMNGWVWAQDGCPRWAQERLVELQMQGMQLGYQYGRTGDFETFSNGMRELNNALSELPEPCLRQLQAQPGGQSDRMLCQQQWDNFNRCVREFNYKTAAGLNPFYTCQRPTCTR